MQPSAFYMFKKIKFDSIMLLEDAYNNNNMTSIVGDKIFFLLTIPTRYINTRFCILYKGII